MDGEWPPVTVHLLTQVYRLGQENFNEKADRFNLEKDVQLRRAFLTAMDSDSFLLMQELDETLRAQVLESMSRVELGRMLVGHHESRYSNNREDVWEQKASFSASLRRCMARFTFRTLD
jgi:hypothetical protein